MTQFAIENNAKTGVTPRAWITFARAVLVVMAMLAGIGCFGGAPAAEAQTVNPVPVTTSDAEIPARTEIIEASVAEASVADPVAVSGPEAIVINEILAHTDQPLQDSVELHNLSAEAVDISHWCISDKNDDPCRESLPAGTVIAPFGFFVFGLEDAAFGLSELGETVTISAADANGTLLGYTDRVKFGPTPNGVSLGRVTTSDGVKHYPMLAELSLGAVNGAVRRSPFAIDQIMYHPAAGKPQYIRITNHTDVTQRLHHLELSGHPWELDGVGDMPLPDGLSLQPDESLYFTGGTPQAMRSAYGLGASTKVLGPWQGNLKDDGKDRLALLRPDVQEKDMSVPMVEVDSVEFGISAPWPVIALNAGVALQRISPWAFGQEPGNWTNQPVQSLWLPSVASR